jgi:DNA-binding XRE family transcriptional regulator
MGEPIFTRTPAGEEIVILARPEYERLQACWQATAEDAADAAAARRVLDAIATGEEELLTEAEVDELLSATSPVGFWRRKRGLSQAALASAAGVTQSRISQMERNVGGASVETLKKVAQALHVGLDDLVA